MRLVFAGYYEAGNGENPLEIHTKPIW